ncbi:Oxidoreductase domain protein [Candidatus Sulfopaludibacter sp. SbA3]|nr:Oxidoreductase domain protein [Candidatus Sulfopaludibacter sp. SbA3]
MSPTRRAMLGALTAASYSRIRGANERVQLGFIGYGLIGKQHVSDFSKLPDAECAAVAEVHSARLDEGITACGGRARPYRDFRKLLDDNDLQAVVLSTPDHWHCAMTILACAAGKDVYVEKPMTVFVREGRWMAEAARKYQRVVQVGTQQRSGQHYAKAIGLMRAGAIGDIHAARIAMYRNAMPGFGSPADGVAPGGFDYDMWLGPAPMRPYNPNRGIYHFRWYWDYSGGQMTNLGAHDVDVVQWLLNSDGPKAVSSMGGRWSLQDNGETPDTQDATFLYEPNLVLQWSMREAGVGRGQGQGLEFFGTKGSMTLSRGGFQIYPDMKQPPENLIPQILGHPAGGPVKTPAQPVPWIEASKEAATNNLFTAHARNFVDRVKSRRQPNATVENGHRTATACHLANISLRLGGRAIRWDSRQEEIVGDKEAASYLVRPYRRPWDEVLRLVNG